MGVKFYFSAFGILAICALALVLYFLGNTEQFQMSSEASTPFLYLGVGIAAIFMMYMFMKMFMRRH